MPVRIIEECRGCGRYFINSEWERVTLEQSFEFLSKHLQGGELQIRKKLCPKCQESERKRRCSCGMPLGV